MKTLTGATDLILSLAFSPDSTILATGDADQTVRLWDVASGTELPFAQKLPFDIYGIAYSADGTMLAASGNSHANTVLWDVASGKQIHDFQGYNTYGFGPDGTVMLVGDIDTVALWDMASYTPRLELSGADMPVFSPDGSLIASGNPSGEVRICGGVPLDGEQPLQ